MAGSPHLMLLNTDQHPLFLSVLQREGEPTHNTNTNSITPTSAITKRLTTGENRTIHTMSRGERERERHAQREMLAPTSSLVCLFVDAHFISCALAFLTPLSFRMDSRPNGNRWIEWYGMAWYGMVWYGMGTVWNGMGWNWSIQFNSIHRRCHYQH